MDTYIHTWKPYFGRVTYLVHFIHARRLNVGHLQLPWSAQFSGTIVEVHDWDGPAIISCQVQHVSSSIRVTGLSSSLTNLGYVGIRDIGGSDIM